MGQLVALMEHEEHPTQPGADRPGGRAVDEVRLLDDVVLPLKEDEEQMLVALTSFSGVVILHHAILEHKVIIVRKLYD